MLKRYVIIIFINLFIIVETFAFSVDTKSLQQDVATKCHVVNQAYVPFDKLSSSKIVQLLGWVRDPSSKTLCGGRYVDSINIANTPTPMAIQDMPINITASKHASFAQHGTSIVRGDVTLVQLGREITADCVTFFRDDKTHKILSSTLVGNVNYHEYGKLLVAQRSDLDFINEVYTLDNGFYRLLAHTSSGITNVWGQAKHAMRNAAGILKMRKATYSACPPDAVSWYLWSDKLTLNRDTGRGEAINAIVYFKKAPVFYAPYLSFPLDKRRKSGFLFPDIMYSKNSGYGLFLPYYFNLAPNYDATFTPKFFTRRGVLLEGLFNYLLPSSFGSVNINYIPYDRAFVNLRNNAFSFKEGHARTLLQNSSSDRGFFGLQNNWHLNEHWRGSLNFNYATDDYFLQDFSSAATSINKDQLFNQADINYANENWRFSTGLFGFQTLHPITRSDVDNVKDQYKILPRVSLHADFPNGFGGANYQFDSEAINFVHGDDFNTFKPVVAGGRFNVGSSASLSFNWLGAYITPKINLQATEYTIHDQEIINAPNNIIRVLPLISVDSGAIFSRNIKFFQHSYVQTLEPRLFYLFVPTKNQENIPIFDTILPALDFSQLFRINRFSGNDRIGDANQIVAAVTTRLLNDFGQEKLNAAFGQILVIHKHKVFMPSNISKTPDPLANEVFSPLMGQLQYFITPEISAKANASWDPNYQHFNTSSVNLQYNDNANRVINFWYNYSMRGDSSIQKRDADLNRIGFSLGWKLWQNWNILGNLDYNISYNRAQNYIYGLEYDSCCWAIRLMQNRTFIGVEANNKNKYDTRTYLQFFFKGLGDFGLGNLGSSLPSSISGYNDKHIIGL